MPYIQRASCLIIQCRALKKCFLPRLPSPDDIVGACGYVCGVFARSAENDAIGEESPIQQH
jgi:hypothetical protein